MTSPPTEGKLTFSSSRFGDIEVPGGRTIVFPCGLLGFERRREFVILDPEGEGSVLKWLHSVEDPDLAFVVMDPSLLIPGYDPGVPPEVAESLQGGDGEILTLVIVTVPAGGQNITVNLRAPLFISPSLRQGVQAILTEDHPTRHPLLPPAVSPGHGEDRADARP